MKKLLPSLALLLAPIAALPQASLVINGTSAVTIVENGGTKTTPIYIEIANPLTTAIKTIGTNGWIISESEFNMVKWDIGTSTGLYTMPFGYGTTYNLPLSMNIGTAGVGTGSILFSTYHTIADQATGVTSITGMPSDVNNMAAAIPSGGSPSAADNSYNAVDRFWIMDASKFPYTTKPTITGGGINGIQFTYAHGGTIPEFAGLNNSAKEPKLGAQRFNPGHALGWGDWYGIAGTQSNGATVGIAQSGPVTSANFFRSWTLSNLTDPLPISISTLTSQCDNGAALIQWTSQTEVDNSYYTVKKSTDDVYFETVGIVKAQGTGNSSTPENYQIIDNSPFAGQSYYFLYQTDFDGTESPANIPFTVFTGCGTEITSTINAYNTTSYINVDINSIGADSYNMSLVNMLGQTIFSEEHAVALGNNEIHLYNNVSPGIYILNIRNEKVNYAKKMVIGVK